MPVKLYIDDVRNPPDDSWVVARTAKDAIEILDSGLVISEISFDHDLGEASELTGYDVACHVENLVCDGEMAMPVWHVHSMNPIGRSRITAAMQYAENYVRSQYEC